MLFLYLINLTQVFGIQLKDKSGALTPETNQTNLIQQRELHDCDWSCPREAIGDMWCNQECFNEACAFDGGDCDLQMFYTKAHAHEECSPGCHVDMLNNDSCDDACRNEACVYDIYDCSHETDFNSNFIRKQFENNFGHGSNDGPDLWAAAEHFRESFSHIMHWTHEGQEHHRRLGYEGNYRQAVFDDIKYNRDHMDTPVAQQLSDPDIWQVVDLVCRDCHIPSIFRDQLGVPVHITQQRIDYGAEWARIDMYENLRHYSEEDKEEYRRRGHDGDYWGAVEEYARRSRDNNDSPKFACFEDDQLRQVADIAIRDNFIFALFEEELGVPNNHHWHTPDRREVVAEWVRWDMQEHMQHWSEEGKDHHRRLAQEDNYHQALYDHILWCRDNHPEMRLVQDLGDDEMWGAADLALAKDDLIYQKFEEVLGEPSHHHDDRIWETVHRVRHQFEHELWHMDEGHKDHLRHLGHEDNYHQAVFDHIQRDNWEGLDHDESWHAVHEILHDDLVYRMFDEVLGVPNHHHDPHRIRSTVDRVRHQFEHEMWHWDEGYKDHLRHLGHEGNYHQAVFDHIQKENWDGLNHEESWRAVDEVMHDDLVRRKFEEYLGVPNNFDPRIQWTVDRIRHTIEHIGGYHDEGFKDHLRDLGNNGDFHQAVFDLIQHENHEGLDHDESWHAVHMIMHDDLVTRKFEEQLDVHRDSHGDHEIRATVDRIRHDIEHEMWNWDDEGHKDHLRRLGNEGNYHQAVFDHIQKENHEGLDHDESWRAVHEIMHDDLIPRKFEEVLGVPRHHEVEHRIWSTVERTRHQFEHEMWHWDEGYKEDLRRLGHEGNYHQAVFNQIQRENHDGLNDEEIWRAVDEVMHDDLVHRKFDEVLGVPNHYDHRIREVVDVLRHQFEHEMWHWDEGWKDHLRNLGHHQ